MQTPHVHPSSHPERARALRRCKGGGPLCALTAYDYPTARLLDEAGTDIILVGDSLGMVVLGYPDTTHVTLDDMIRHTSAARRGVTNACLLSDLPYGSCDAPKQALAFARALVAAGADGVKIEGGREILPQIESILEANIPLIGHIGMLPQQVVAEGGYRKKGKTPEGALSLIDDAAALDQAGVAAIVLESVAEETAAAITARVSCPTIGIGSGQATDGQIRVIHDLIGAFPWFRPPFAEQFHDTSSLVRDAAVRFRATLTPHPAPHPAPQP